MNTLAIQADSGTCRPQRQDPRAGHPTRGQPTSPRSTFHRQQFVTSSPREVQPPAEPTETRCPCGSRMPLLPSCQPESLRPTSRAPPFTTTQFHVLLNSLFKVLFNFPSRYLFAIGLGVIFSLTWSLPRTLSCTPKQLDSRGKPAQHVDRLTGLSPSVGHGPSQGGLGLVVASRGGSPKHHIPRDRDGRQFGAGLCPFHSPLLRASQLFSFPPLINMLKFGGSPCLLSGRSKKGVPRQLQRRADQRARHPRRQLAERPGRSIPRVNAVCQGQRRARNLKPHSSSSPRREDGVRAQCREHSWCACSRRDAKPTLSQT